MTSIASRKLSLSLALITVLLLTWCFHQSSQVMVVHAIDLSEQQAGHSHDHDEQSSHQSFGIEHRHLNNTPDHSHDNIDLPIVQGTAVHPLSMLSHVFLAEFPVPPRYRIERPPRSFS